MAIYTWSFDLVGLTPSRGNRWIIAATECYIKWVEVVPLKRASESVVANFIRDNIICKFGIPKSILSDNSTPFVNYHERELFEQYEVDHVNSNPYYL